MDGKITTKIILKIIDLTLDEYVITSRSNSKNRLS